MGMLTVAGLEGGLVIELRVVRVSRATAWVRLFGVAVEVVVGLHVGLVWVFGLVCGDAVDKDESGEVEYSCRYDAHGDANDGSGAKEDVDRVELCCNRSDHTQRNVDEDVEDA